MSADRATFANIICQRLACHRSFYPLDVLWLCTRDPSRIGSLHRGDAMSVVLGDQHRAMPLMRRVADGGQEVEVRLRPADILRWARIFSSDALDPLALC